MLESLRRLIACLALLMALHRSTMAHAQPAPPPQPVAYGEDFDAYGAASGVVAQDHVLYMTWPSGAKRSPRMLAAIDITTPAAPALLDTLELGGFPQDLARVGSHVLVVNGLELLVMDAASPRDLKLAARLPLAEDPVHGPQGIAVKGDIAYLALRRGGIAAVDVADPGKPRLLATLALPGYARDVTVGSDSLLYVASDAMGIHTVDASDPSRLAAVGRLPAPRGCITRIVVQGDTAYAAAGNELIALLSLADPRAPAWLSSTRDRHLLSPYYGAFATDVAVVTLPAADGVTRRHALVADGEGGMIVVDVAQAAAPAFVGALPVEGGPGGVEFVTAVWAAGSVAYLVDEAYGLRVADLSAPDRPVLVGAGVKLAR